MAFPDYSPTLPVMLRELVARFGPKPMIVLGERRLTYAEVEAESARLARGLVAQGVAKGARVAVLFPNGPDFVVAWLAASRIGAVVVPLNTFYKPRELGYVLRHADVHTLLTAPRLLANDYLERLEAAAPSLARHRGGPLFAPELPQLRAVAAFGETGGRAWARPASELLAAADASPVDAGLLAALESEIAPSDPAVLVYSSGSTADPKGALHSHGTLVRHAFNLNQFRDLRADDRIFSPMPFFWVGGLVFSLLSTLHTGACLLCEEYFEPGATLALLERERATIAAGWPHYSKAMAEHPSFRTRDLSAIRAGNLYGVLPESARPRDPELRSNSLGMTETCGPHTIDRMDVDLPERLRGSFGHSVPGVEHKIVDPATGASLPQGGSGEICVRGYSVMQGLHKQEREQTFDRDGFYHTGDVGRFDTEGHLFFEARLGDLIKTAGANVAPREVEVLLEAMPEVSSAFVVGLADPARGQNVAAALVLKSGVSLEPEECRERLRKDLSAYKIPRHVFFLAKEELPFTDSGKIDKRRLAPLLEERLRAQAS
ncbi:MAG TPA: class I adenylate-forming enzyme family protein [Myxococcota bacterium]|nr:class I adenylate-forming enzyme family protein [Myxococcota bacterium]